MNEKMIAFTYTKANGDVSERVGFVLSKPSKNYFIFDVSDMDEEDVVAIEQQYRMFMEEQKLLLSKYRLTQYLKQFKPEGMSDVQNFG